MPLLKLDAQNFKRISGKSGKSGTGLQVGKTAGRFRFKKISRLTERSAIANRYEGEDCGLSLTVSVSGPVSPGLPPGDSVKQIST